MERHLGFDARTVSFLLYRLPLRTYPIVYRTLRAVFQKILNSNKYNYANYFQSYRSR